MTERAGSGGRRDDGLVLAVLAFILLTTVAWWSLALWPVPGGDPEWLGRVRAVCFSVTGSGLPDATGWMLLVGQPLGMVGLLVLVWREATAGALRRLVRSPGGRGVLVGTAVGIALGLAATGVRVAGAVGAPEVRLPPDGAPFGSLPRLGLEIPEMALVDARGREVTEESLRGRSAFVTFAFGHCETICPLLVRSALEARDRLEGREAVRIVVITVDPWRDTPARLAHLAEGWGLASEDLLLSGPPERVEEALDAWKVPRSRDLRTGDVEHPALTYVLDREGRIAFASSGGVESLVALARRLSEGG